jgi:hypothetical protein
MRKHVARAASERDDDLSQMFGVHLLDGPPPAAA